MSMAGATTTRRDTQTASIKPRVLIVEDETALVELLRYNLEQSGFRVSVAYDGEEALASVQEDVPDLVLLDWMLPLMSGIEVCRQLRRQTSTANLPIIMLTARGEEGDRVRGLDAGADDYVAKPFSPTELVARIRAVLRRIRPALADEALSYADIVMDLVAHRVTRAGKPVHLGPDRVPPAAPFHGASRPRLLARAAARRGVGQGRLCRGAHRRRPYPPPAHRAQRRRSTPT